MATQCTRCKGRETIGRGRNRGPCPACSSAAGGVGDKVVGAGQRIADRVIGRQRDVTGRTTTTQAHHLGTKTARTRKPRAQPAKKKTPAKKPTTPPAVRGPICDTCRQGGGVIRMTSAGLHHVGGCPPQASA